MDPSRSRTNFLSRLSAIVVAVAAPVTAMAITVGGGGDPRALDLSQKFDLSADPATQGATYVATQAEGKLKGIKRIAITNMCVQFVSSKSALGVSRGATRTYTRTASADIPGGLDPVKMQAVADAWLAQIEADFEAVGIEVLPYEQIAGNEVFQKFAAKYDRGIREGERWDVNNQKGDTGEAVVYVSPKGRPFAPDCGTISPASTGTFVRMAYPLNAEFLTISAVVDLGQAQASGGLLRGANAQVNYAQFIRAGDSQFQFVGKTGPGARVWLKQSIVPQRDPFRVAANAQVERDRSHDDLRSTTTFSTSTARQVSFDEALYYANAAQHLNAMHRIFLQKIVGK